ncbi:MAG: hypothetical protein QM529_00625 [Hydrotalea sp.]|nr:hypothetical protein [Hydrotalea sp.]
MKHRILTAVAAKRYALGIFMATCLVAGGINIGAGHAWAQSGASSGGFALAPRNSFYGNINAEFAINGNEHLPLRIGGGASFDLGYIFGNNRVFINSGLNYLSGTPSDYVFFGNYNTAAFTFVHVPLTLNYGVVLNAGRVSFIPSIGFGYGFSTTYGYDNNNGGKPSTFNTGSFIVGPKLSVIYNLGDSGFIGGTGGGYVFASQFLKLSYAVVAFTGGARF